MAIPPRTRVTFSGIFGTEAAPLEIWQMNLSFPQAVFANEAERVAVAQQMSGSWAVHLAPKVKSIAVLTNTRLAQIGADGLVSKDPQGAYHQGDYPSVINGTGTGDVHPLQTSVCISLDTLRSGPTGRGRFFLPAPAMTLGPDTRLTTGARDAFATSATSFIEAINTNWFFGVPLDEPGVGGVQVASSKGYLSRVTSIRCGRVADTQRRRRGDLLEDYTTRFLP